SPFFCLTFTVTRPIFGCPASTREADRTACTGITSHPFEGRGGIRCAHFCNISQGESQMRKLVLAVAHAKRAFFSSRGEAALCAALVLGMALGSRPAEATAFAYVTSFADNTVSVIDTATN